MDDRVAEFKNEARQYKFYVARIYQLREQLDIAYYQMSGLKSVDNTRIRGSFNPEQAELVRLEQSEKIQQIEDELMIYEAKTRRINRVLENIDQDIAVLIKEAWCRQKGLQFVADNEHYTLSNISKKITKEEYMQIIPKIMYFTYFKNGGTLWLKLLLIIMI